MKTVLIIGFSINKHYNRRGYNNLLNNYDKIYFTLPNEHFWKGFFLIHPGRWKGFFLEQSRKIYKKIKTIFGFYKISNNDSEWINFKFLKKNPSFLRAKYLYPKLKYEFQSLKESFTICKNISLSLNKDSFIIPIKGIDSSGYLIDSFQRFVPNFQMHKMKSPLVFVRTLLYVYNIIIYLNWLEKFAERNKIDSVIINHQYYMESGFISCYLNKKFNSKIIHFSFKQKYPALVDPRVKWFKKTLDKKVSDLLLSKKEIVDVKKDIYYHEHSLFDFEDCSKKTFDTNTIVIIMHCFEDANSMHGENSVIFSSYFQWIRSTLSIAKNHKDIKYIFRTHPASFSYYPSDIKTLKYLFGNIKEKNIKYEVPGNYSQLISKDKIPLFVTAKSNFSQELAIAGVKCITLDDSSAPNNCCKKITSKKEYIKWLSGKGNFEELKLSERQRFVARLNKQIYADLNNLV